MDSSNFKRLCLIKDINRLFKLVEERELAKRNLFLQRFGVSPEQMFDERDVVVFGAGGLGKKITAQLLKHNKKPLYICDNNPGKWEQKVFGIDIKSPENLIADRNRIVALVAMDWNGDVCAQLDKIGVEYLFYDKNGELGCCPQPALYNEKENLIKVNEMFFDDFSRKVLLNILKARFFPELFFRNLGNPFIQDIASGPQFFDRQYFLYGDNEVIIDCGAYHADALVGFYKLVYELGLKEPKAYIFEADDTYCEKALAVVEKYGFCDVKLIKAAVGDRNANISLFESGYCQEAEEDGVIRMCKLDSELRDIPVSFIKMDIEGYEYNALKGAEEIIRKYKPKLAVSAYHYANDLCRIPMLIHSMNPDYKIFLRHHLYQSFSETVCYACLQYTNSDGT